VPKLLSQTNQTAPIFYFLFSHILPRAPPLFFPPFFFLFIVFLS
jgi:hypothetical protein